LAFLDEHSATLTGRSTCKVKEGVDVYVAVKGQRSGDNVDVQVNDPNRQDLFARSL
jgi:hypothetical protein